MSLTPIQWLTAQRLSDIEGDTGGLILTDTTRKAAIKAGDEQWGRPFFLQRCEADVNGVFFDVGAPECIQ